MSSRADQIRPCEASREGLSAQFAKFLPSGLFFWEIFNSQLVYIIR